jgi:hypothetical protein
VFSNQGKCVVNDKKVVLAIIIAGVGALSVWAVKETAYTIGKEQPPSSHPQPTKPYQPHTSEYQQKWPEYAAYLSGDDTARDRCIIDNAQHLRAYRQDYVSAAAAACGVPDAIRADQKARAR